VESLLCRSREEAAGLNHNYVGTEHLLLAIIAGAGPSLACLLSHFGISHGRMREIVIELLGA
jgi:ATP-dependent Clp protease ATP-binding subunit ClpC